MDVHGGCYPPRIRGHIGLQYPRELQSDERHVSTSLKFAVTPCATRNVIWTEAPARFLEKGEREKSAYRS